MKLNDEKIIKQIKEYDKSFDNNNYVYACIEGGFNNTKKYYWLFFGIMLFLLNLYIEDFFYGSIIVGILVGIIISYINKYGIIIKEKDGIYIYIFNLFFTKVVGKYIIENKDLEIIKIRKTSIWYTVKFKNKNQKLKLVISKKTLGLKYQEKNVEQFIKELKKYDNRRNI